MVEGASLKSTDNSKQSNVRGGHFLAEDPALFDAKFFNLTAEVAAVSLPACLICGIVAFLKLCNIRHGVLTRYSPWILNSVFN
jgi:hypothetical protein